MTRGRPPKGEESTATAIQIRMTDEERALFQRLVDHRAAQLAPEGVRVTGPDVIRWLIRSKCAEMGLDATEQKGGKAPRKAK